MDKPNLDLKKDLIEFIEKSSVEDFIDFQYQVLNTLQEEMKTPGFRFKDITEILQALNGDDKIQNTPEIRDVLLEYFKYFYIPGESKADEEKYTLILYSNLYKINILVVNQAMNANIQLTVDVFEKDPRNPYIMLYRTGQHYDLLMNEDGQMMLSLDEIQPIIDFSRRQLQPGVKIEEF